MKPPKPKRGLLVKPKRGSVTRITATGPGPVELRFSTAAKMRVLYGKVERGVK